MRRKSGVFDLALPSEDGVRLLLEQHRQAHDQQLRDASSAERCTLRAELKPATNTMSTGLQAVDKALRAGMTVDPGCRGLIAELPGYTWAPNKSTGGFHERPVEVGDDACDALRYAVMEFEPDPENPWAALAGSSAGGVA